MAVILDLIETGIAPFDSQTQKTLPYIEPNIKWIRSSVAKMWPFKIRHITSAFTTPF